MKIYAPIDILHAREKTARPISDFIDSQNWQNIMDGIMTKFGFSGEQKMLIDLILVSTLTQLEPTSALETNIHQLLPELSNEKTRELVADIRDRVIREADRRVAENIINSKFDWYEAVLGEKPTVDQLEARKKRFREETERGLSVEEIRRLAEEDARKQQEQEEREEAEYAAALKAQGKVPLSDEDGEDAPETLDPAPTLSLAQSVAIQTAEEKMKTPEAAAVDGIRSVSIAQSKLRAPSAAVPVETTSALPLAEAAAAPKPATLTPPPAPKRVDGIDPYREIPE